MADVAQRRGLDAWAIMWPEGREQKRARAEAFQLMRWRLGWSSPQVALYFHCHHSTVLAACGGKRRQLAIHDRLSSCGGRQ